MRLVSGESSMPERATEIAAAKDILGDVPEDMILLRAALGAYRLVDGEIEHIGTLGVVARDGDKIALQTIGGYTEIHDYVET